MNSDALSAAEILALEPCGDRHQRSVRNQDNRAGMIFGGQLLGQALASAASTVAGLPAHSLSAMFVRPGMVDEPVDYAVEILRDGRRFSQRRVLATQAGRPIFDCLCSFHDPEEGGEHQMGNIEGVPPPEYLPGIQDYVVSNADNLPSHLVGILRLPFPVEVALIDPDAIFLENKAFLARDHWFRIPSALAITDPSAQQCLLAFASDYWLAGIATGGRDVAVASLNHSMWFHALVDVSEWLLYRAGTPWAGLGRGIACGLIYDRSGRLVASVAQEISARARQT